MRMIIIYNIEAEIIDEICDINDVTEADVIEALMEYVEDVKVDQGWN